MDKPILPRIKPWRVAYKDVAYLLFASAGEVSAKREALKRLRDMFGEEISSFDIGMRGVDDWDSLFENANRELLASLPLYPILNLRTLVYAGFYNSEPSPLPMDTPEEVFINLAIIQASISEIQEELTAQGMGNHD